jgi:hypothetical protein
MWLSFRAEGTVRYRWRVEPSELGFAGAKELT